jgi:hypothetical protein
MKTWLPLMMLLLVPAFSDAQARKPCEELKSEIAAKLDAKNVKNYTLDIAEKDADEAGAKVVGTCDGGMKKILYKRAAQ